MVTKRIAALLLVLVLSLGLCPAMAVSINDPSVFVKQQTHSTCTLASATMMLRRKAFLDGDANWSAITEGAVRKVAWSGGLAWNFTYNGMKVSVMRRSSGWAGGSLESKRTALVELLAAHPEGIVGYSTSQPHAVLLTDYDVVTGTFYCAEPADYYPSGRVELVRSSIRGGDQDAVLSRIDQLWYISSGISNGAGTGVVPDEFLPQPEPEVEAENAIQEGPYPTQEGNWGLACSLPVDVDGTKVLFPMFILKDEQENEVNYIQVRDLAKALSGAQVQFNVGYDQGVVLTTNTPYQFDGSEMTSPLQGYLPYGIPTIATKVNGSIATLDAVQLTDDQGGGHTYYKLRDLARVLDIYVGWDADRGIYIDTAQAYQE